MTQTAERAGELYQLLTQSELLGSCASVLSWDEQTCMPAGGAEHRANQLGLLAGLTHERRTSPRIGEVLSELESGGDLGDPHGDLASNVREARRTWNRATKLPRRLVEELTRTTSLAQQVWKEARKDKAFSVFQPWLDKLIGLKREEAAAIGYAGGVPYDALLDEYEPGARSVDILAVFAPLRDELVKLVAAIQSSGRQPRNELLERHYPIEAQQVFAEAAAKLIGFDFERGRIDRSAHPFCSAFGPGDCRLTTRYHDHHFSSAFFGVLHEAGHGIYEQGLPPEAFGLPLGQAVSLGIHESQSRLWENFVGRGRAFWNYLYPHARTAFPVALGSTPLEQFYAAINDVHPSFIRVEADEVTYNLHIMLRFELEVKLLDGSLAAADVPTAWNETFRNYFEITPPDDSVGCLQDIHWSAGLMGYFPTYALGNMYAAQFFESAEAAQPDLQTLFASGQFRPLKSWLNEQIHRHGRRYTATDLVQVVTGRPLSADPLVKHLWNKYAELYGL